MSAPAPELPQRTPGAALSVEDRAFDGYSLAELLTATEVAMTNMRSRLAMTRAAALDDDRPLMTTYARGAEDQALLISATTREIARRMSEATSDPTKETN